jgi:hypothetical protein
MILTAGALLLAGDAAAQGRSGGAPGGPGVGAGIGAGGLTGPAGLGVRSDAWTGNQASAHAADQARSRADIHSPIGTTAHGSASVSDDVDTHSQTRRETARAKRQGPAHAADQAIANANANAGLATGSAPGSLTGLAKGLTVKDSSGATLGTVSRIKRSHDGTVRTVLVAGSAGEHHTIRLAPDSLSVSGGVVTTTQVLKR